jgi:serine-type D-Ala-D-Ala carboxypeptidase/endopeptidase
MKIGLAWLFENDTHNYWHNGGTGGYSSYALFNPQGDYGSFADRLGAHIAQRLTGKPAVLLHD